MRRAVSLFLIFSGLIVLILSGWLLVNQQLSQPAAAPLPTELIQIPLTNHLQGTTAAEEFTQLHGKSFFITSASVGRYGLRGEITIWAAGAPFEFIIKNLVLSMRDKIANTSSPFTPTGTRHTQEITIYELTGMGQSHFYFQVGTHLIWLAVDPSIAEPVLQESVEFYLQN